jgi:hypothetical protein
MGIVSLELTGAQSLSECGCEVLCCEKLCEDGSCLVPVDLYTCTETSISLYRASSEVLLRIHTARDALSFGTFRSGVVPPATGRVV